MYCCILDFRDFTPTRILKCESYNLNGIIEREYIKDATARAERKKELINLDLFQCGCEIRCHLIKHGTPRFATPQ
jgi:hypothetical protein